MKLNVSATATWQQFSGKKKLGLKIPSSTDLGNLLLTVHPCV